MVVPRLTFDGILVFCSISRRKSCDLLHANREHKSLIGLDLGGTQTPLCHVTLQWQVRACPAIIQPLH